MKTITILGATGFLGKALISELLKSNDSKIIILMRETSNSLFQLDSRIICIRYHTLTGESLINSLKEHSPDIFINLAWKGVFGSLRNEDFQVLENLPIAINATVLASLAGCKQYVGIGSQAEYGNQNKRIDEFCQTKPTSVYGKAKLASYYASSALCQLNDMILTWIRVFSTYGPGDNPKWFIPYIIGEILEGRTPKLTMCEQKWDYLYFEDAAKGIISLANLRSDGIFNLGSGNAISLRTIVNEILTQLNSKIMPEFGALNYRDDQIFYLEANITKIIEETGWEPSVKLEEGIRQTILKFKEKINQK